MNRLLLWLVCLTVGAMLAAAVGAADATTIPTDAKLTTTTPVLTQTLPQLRFIPNQGQWDSRVSYYAAYDRAAIWFTDKGPRVRIGGKSQTCVFDIRFMGMSPKCTIQAERRRTDLVNIYHGNQQDTWRNGLPTYSAICYHNAYPGIDIRYYNREHSWEYDLVVHPGADLTDLVLYYDGIDSLTIDDGTLHIHTPTATISERLPIVYEADGTNTYPCDGRFVLKDSHTVGFAVTNRQLPHASLVIDPVLEYATYFGGANNDKILEMTEPLSGHIFIVGTTASSDFPILNATQPVNSGNYDAFVAKFDTAGSLMFSTFFGGSDYDVAYGVTIGTDGYLYVCGSTESSDLPTMFAYQQHQGEEDAFVARFYLNGILNFSTYLGGEDDDRAMQVIPAGSGTVWIGGKTTSYSFPTVNAFQSSYGDFCDLFISKLSFNTYPVNYIALDYSSYLGDDLVQGFGGIATDASGNLYVAGTFMYYESHWPPMTFPMVHAIKDTMSGWYDNCDGFLCSLTPSGSTLRFSTLFGGSNSDWITSMDIDPSGVIVIAGDTESDDLPTTGGAFQTTRLGARDAYWSKFVWVQATLSLVMTYSSYLSGSYNDYMYWMRTDNSGYVYMTGHTDSDGFPVTAPQMPQDGAWIAKFNGGVPSFINIISPQHYYDVLIPYILAPDQTGGVWVAGYSPGDALTFDATDDAFQSNNNGNNDGALLHVIDGTAPDTLTIDSITVDVSFGGFHYCDFQTHLKATWPCDFDTTTATEQTLALYGSLTGWHETLYISFNGPSDNTVVVGSGHPFAYGETVTLTATTGLESTAGTPLDHPGVWQQPIWNDNPQDWTYDTGSREFATDEDPVGICAADFNDDGEYDIATANFDGQNISVLFDTDSDSLTPPTNYACQHRCWGITAADFDLDGSMDIAYTTVAEVMVPSDSICIRMNNGDGTFGAATSQANGGDPRDICAADLNGDRCPDLVIALSKVNSIAVMLNQGNGTFVPISTYGLSLGTKPLMLDVADFDGDFDLDVVTANPASDKVTILFNNGSGAFSSATDFNTDADPRDVIAGDVDGDGDPDVVVACFDDNVINVFKNDGTGNLYTKATIPTGAGPAGLVLLYGMTEYTAPYPNLAVLHRTDGTVGKYYNDQSGGFTLDTTHAVGLNPMMITTFPGSSSPVLVTSNSTSDNVSVLGYEEGSGCCAGMRGNLDGDAEDKVNISDMTYLVAFLFSGGPDPVCAEEADVNADGATNISDMTYLVAFLFSGGPDPMPC